MNSVRDRVFSVIEATFDIDSEELEESMVADDIDGWDSLSHVTVILMLSKEFDLNISPSDTEDLDNIGKLVELIESRVR